MGIFCGEYVDKYSVDKVKLEITRKIFAIRYKQNNT